MSGHEQELEKLTVLCQELAKLGLNVGMSDARPAVSVRADRSGPPWWIAVDASGEVFECHEPEARFPIDDPTSAAASIAQRVKAMRTDSGEVS